MGSVLVTGAGRGIGQAIALRLAEHGWDVHAGVRRAEDGERLRGLDPAGGARIRPVLLDVADATSVASLAESLGGRLDALVNNAGIVLPGPLEGIRIADLREQMEVNVVAQVAVTQAVLPLLRASRGRVVLIGSISGRLSAPLLGAYSASKFAVAGLADALRMELRPWGIRVALVEPGSIDTDLWRRAPQTADETEAKLTAEHRALYADQLLATRRLAARIQRSASPPSTVAAAVEHALTDARPRARYLVGVDARVQATMARLPAAVRDLLLARVSGTR